MRQAAALLGGWVVSVAGAAIAASAAIAAARAADEVEPVVIAKFAIAGGQQPYVARVESCSATGTLRLARFADEPGPVLPRGGEVTEGYYLGVLQKEFQRQRSLEGASLLRVRICEVEAGDKVRAEVGAGLADKLTPGAYLILVRPKQATTAELKAVPDFMPCSEGPSPAEQAPPQGANAQAAQLAVSVTHLKQIGLAMHKFHDVYHGLPPAIIRGPDGKPWHSWRVLLLPFLEQMALYRQYRFDEPWDGPHNRQLIDKMPAVFGDPIHDTNPQHYAHYAVVTGHETAFSAEGTQLDGQKPNLSGGKAFRHILDGASNSLLVGPISSDQKIVWTEPRDLQWTENAPGLHSKVGFALPYTHDGRRCGPFLLADGSVHVFVLNADAQMFRALLTIAGKEVIDWDAIGRTNVPFAGRPQVRRQPVIYLLREAGQVTARLVEETEVGGPVPAAAARPPLREP